VVIIDHYNREYLLELGKIAHGKGIGFILAGNLGLYGYTFVDFGESHTVLDGTGEEARAIHVAGITLDEQGLVCLHEGKRHGLNDGDSVVFREVKGMTEINGLQFQITVKTPYSFTIGDTRSFSPYVGGGIANEVKVPWILKSYDLEKSLRYPYPPESRMMPIANWDKFGIPEQLHAILNGLYIFYQKHNRLPKALNLEDAAEL
jgi:ubiquitin-activating enzyme E1